MYADNENIIDRLYVEQIFLEFVPKINDSDSYRLALNLKKSVANQSLDRIYVTMLSFQNKDIELNIVFDWFNDVFLNIFIK